MKYAAIGFVVGVFLLGLTLYLATTIVNPINEEQVNQIVDFKQLEEPEQFYPEVVSLVKRGVISDYIVVNRFILVVGVGIAGIAALFLSLHLFIDKLFFKEFYKDPNYFTAGRRAIFLGLTLAGFIGFRLLGIDFVSSLLILVLWMLVEGILWLWGRQHKLPPKEPAGLDRDVIIEVDDEISDEE